MIQTKTANILKKVMDRKRVAPSDAAKVIKRKLAYRSRYGKDLYLTEPGRSLLLDFEISRLKKRWGILT